MKKPQPAIKVLPLEQQKKLSNEMLTNVEIMLKLRFSGSDWNDRFAQFRAENELRKG